VGGVVLGAYRDLFGVVATSAATLTGLLFVAMSVANSRSRVHSPVVRQFRAAAALLAFTNALAVSLFALVPGTNIGYPAVVVGTIGVFFTGAGIRTTFTLSESAKQRRPQVYLIVLLLVTFGFELADGIDLIINSRQSGAVTTIGDILIASLLLGVARAWELVGEWDTGVVSSIALLIGHKSMIEAPSDLDPSEMPGTADEPEPVRDPVV
jgi:hypothetical protein